MHESSHFTSSQDVHEAPSADSQESVGGVFAYSWADYRGSGQRTQDLRGAFVAVNLLSFVNERIKNVDEVNNTNCLC